MTAMSEGGVDRAAEAVRLYGLPLDEFIAERDATAKRLRADDREAAAAIRKLRKPSAAAAAINRAVRADPDAAAKLLEAGERLEAAQSAAISGSAGDLREAAAEQGDAVERLMETVADELGGRGAIADRARETLRAIAADPGLREQFAAGTLVREAEAVGFGVDALAALRPGAAAEISAEAAAVGGAAQARRARTGPRREGSQGGGDRGRARAASAGARATRTRRGRERRRGGSRGARSGRGRAARGARAGRPTRPRDEPWPAP